MRPNYVRILTDEERRELEKGLRSSSAFVMRRCQILLSSARCKTANQIAAELHCSGQAVRNTIRAFETEGLECLIEKSHARRYCQMLWIKTSSAANIDGVSVNTSATGSGRNISASPLGNSTPAFTRATW
jgi:biotin operon repressor